MLNKEIFFCSFVPNTTTMIIVLNLYKMHLTLSDDGRWIKAYTAPLPSQLVGNGSSITSRTPNAPNLSNSHTILLREMYKLCTHNMDKFVA